MLKKIFNGRKEGDMLERRNNLELQGLYEKESITQFERAKKKVYEIRN